MNFSITQNSTGSIMIKIGGAIALIALFLTFWKITMFGTTISFSGLDFITDEKLKDLTDYQKYLPLMSALLGIVAIALSFIKNNKVVTIVICIISVIILALCAIWYSWMADNNSTEYISYGLYLQIIAALIILLGGALCIKETAKSP
ncbi:MAG: hypothetical protein RBR05_01020 [Candidatus Methanomethylophilaceae archaeon]|nr:hypothetical protein [Candidatus Methanomethylophilaceae archaeon]MDY0223971.1 hypothetical protein [Candidatus Methanomethylophilaceae archaeon]